MGDGMGWDSCATLQVSSALARPLHARMRRGRSGAAGPKPDQTRRRVAPPAGSSGRDFSVRFRSCRAVHCGWCPRFPLPVRLQRCRGGISVSADFFILLRVFGSRSFVLLDKSRRRKQKTIGSSLPTYADRAPAAINAQEESFAACEENKQRGEELIIL